MPASTNEVPAGVIANLCLQQDPLEDRLYISSGTCPDPRNEPWSRHLTLLQIRMELVIDPSSPLRTASKSKAFPIQQELAFAGFRNIFKL